MFLLFRFELRGSLRPHPSARLLEMINSQRGTEVARQNYQAGMRTLATHGLINVYRAQNLSLAYQLTDEGRMHAEMIYCDRTREDEKDEA
ncbi:MAG: hypothetical protein ACRCTP_17695 [Aeromonas popoffii]|uniref:hypothetical protein n=1 Tax=Aeromonas popoffii TaxID=70856 RepID=UPI003F2C4CCE